MKRLKFPLFAVAMVMALVSAFAFNTKPAPTTATSYHYIGAFTDAEVKKPINWVEEESDCPVTGGLPCSINTSLTRANFDLMVQGFTHVSDANTAASTREPQ